MTKKHLDRQVAFTFAGMAMDALGEGKLGLMTAIHDGCYQMVEIPDPKLRPARWISFPCTTPSATARSTATNLVCRSS